ncbi:ketopantoate reductase family protein [Legionella tunisiensis]|uniref:ketopantoate reductase family protein n=1 Tax=Legionella tunisiensis TaxID=1034944 RepID=UPI000318FF87|nr:2-dehydropantoate 2-reductase [Legionella tunisiensis]
MITVTVIGSGAIGKFYGALFTLAGLHVCHLERSDFSILQQQKYYELEMPDGTVIEVTPKQIEKDYRQLPKSDIILIALKTTANDVLKEILPYALKPESKIIILQNGIGNEEYLTSFIKENCSILCGVTTTGATRIRPGYIKIKYLGELKLAPFKTEQSVGEEIKRLFKSSVNPAIYPKIQLAENHRILRWTKLLWNIPFSSLAVLFNTPVEVLATQADYQKIVRTLMHEVCLVAKLDKAEIASEIEKLLAGTAKLHGFYPSMYVDFQEGRRLESQYIIANVIDYATTHGLDTPVLSFIYKKLLELEKMAVYSQPVSRKKFLR